MKLHYENFQIEFAQEGQEKACLTLAAKTTTTALERFKLRWPQSQKKCPAMLYLDWTFAQSQMSKRIGRCHEMLVLVHQVTRDCLKHLFTQSPNEAGVCKPQR